MVTLGMTEQRVLRELGREESLRLLGSVSLGRVVFTHRALPAIRPVNHLVDDGQVIIRTHPGAAILSAAERGVVVAYEADLLDLETHLGWSVVVTGVARPVRDPQAADDYRRRLRPWIDRPMDQVITISSEIVTGFALTAGETGEESSERAHPPAGPAPAAPMGESAVPQTQYPPDRSR